MAQANEYKSLVNNNAWNKTLEFILFQNYDHSLNAVRTYEGKEWEQSERYQNILEYVSSKSSEAKKNLPVEVTIKKMLGKNVANIEAKLLIMGFMNIETVRNTEAVKVKERNVISIRVNGSTEDGWYKRSSEVVIEYFEAKTEEEIALEHLGKIKIGESQKHFLGRNYKEVKTELEGLGFENFNRKKWQCLKLDEVKKRNV